MLKFTRKRNETIKEIKKCKNNIKLIKIFNKKLKPKIKAKRRKNTSDRFEINMTNFRILFY